MKKSSLVQPLSPRSKRFNVWELDYPKKPKKALLASNRVYHLDPILPINNKDIQNQVIDDAYCKLCGCFILLFLIIGCVCVLVFVIN